MKINIENPKTQPKIHVGLAKVVYDELPRDIKEHSRIKENLGGSLVLTVDSIEVLQDIVSFDATGIEGRTGTEFWKE